MDKDLDQFTRENLLKSVELSEGAFDKNLNFISAGALLLSISFLDKLVPVKASICKGMLVASWSLLIGSLITNVFAHWLASRNAMKTLGEHDRKDLNALGRTFLRNKKMNNITTGAALSMSAGLICLIIYCSINLFHMQEDKKTQGPDEGKFGMPSYVPAVTPEAPANTQPDTTQPANTPAISTPDTSKKP